MTKSSCDGRIVEHYIHRHILGCICLCTLYQRMTGVSTQVNIAYTLQYTLPLKYTVAIEMWSRQEGSGKM